MHNFADSCHALLNYQLSLRVTVEVTAVKSPAWVGSATWLDGGLAGKGTKSRGGYTSATSGIRNKLYGPVKLVRVW